jgi:hypothetical protein
VSAALEAPGAELGFRPRSAPDRTPIAERGSKVQAGLRQSGVRAQEARSEALGVALGQVTPGAADGWFQNCGYTNRQS